MVPPRYQKTNTRSVQCGVFLHQRYFMGPRSAHDDTPCGDSWLISHNTPVFDWRDLAISAIFEFYLLGWCCSCFCFIYCGQPRKSRWGGAQEGRRLGEIGGSLSVRVMKITKCTSLRTLEAFGLLSTASYGTAGTSYAQDARRFNRKIWLHE